MALSALHPVCSGTSYAHVLLSPSVWVGLTYGHDVADLIMANLESGGEVVPCCPAIVSCE